MAEKKQKPEAVEATAPKAAEPKYTVAEFAANAARLFGANSDIVNAAFMVAGIKVATLSEAKETVRAFMQKEVK